MFRKIREIFSKAIDKISEKMEKISEERFGKEISQEDISKLSDELIIDLVEADVAYEVAENIIKDLEKKIVGSRIGLFEDKKRFIKDKFREILIEYLKKGEWNKDLVEMIKSSAKPYKILFMGVNGVGKTTTIAKVAKYLRDRGLKVLVVAADTFRAGAQEQLEIHCKKLSIPIFRGRYGYDPAALVFDSIKYAQKNGFDVILIDSAGRQHTDIDLMNEIKKISRVSSPDLKILVLDALTGNDAVNQAIEFDKHIGVDGVILTKLDADASGGSALSIIMTISKPIIFVGVGQKYDDLISYKADLIIEKIIE